MAGVFKTIEFGSGMAAFLLDYGRITCPPVIGRGTPVVVGKLIGRPRSVRTARKAKACASMASADQPAASAVPAVAGLSRSVSIRIRVGLRAPPPATIQHR